VSVFTSLNKRSLYTSANTSWGRWSHGWFRDLAAQVKTGDPLTSCYTDSKTYLLPHIAKVDRTSMAA
jgi:hypothetical protein